MKEFHINLNNQYLHLIIQLYLLLNLSNYKISIIEKQEGPAIELVPVSKIPLQTNLSFQI